MLADGLEQELDRAGVLVADVARERDGGSAHRVADRGVEVRGRRDLDDLLVAPLERAVALEQVHHRARTVREDLHLDVPRAQDGALEEHGRVTERPVGLAHRGGEGLGQVVAGVDPAHAATATAGHGLDEDREPDDVGGREELVDVRGRRRGRQHREAGLTGRLQRTDLVAGELEDVRGRADEDEAGCGGRPRERRVLGQEAVPRVDRVGARLLRDTDHLVDVEVGAHGVSRLADGVRLVGLEPVLGVTVLVREDSDRPGA